MEYQAKGFGYSRARARHTNDHCTFNNNILGNIFENLLVSLQALKFLRKSERTDNKRKLMDRYNLATRYGNKTRAVEAKCKSPLTMLYKKHGIYKTPDQQLVMWQPVI